MKILFINAKVADVFNCMLVDANVLVEDQTIVGLGDYTAEDADEIIDCRGKVICPGLIDGHIHIESTMMEPTEFVKACLPHGTTAVFADPHEIANVCGTEGIRYMLEASEGLPVTIYCMLPSCVPATGFDESWEEITAEKLVEFYDSSRVPGLAEMMNYVGVIFEDEAVIRKIEMTHEMGKIVDGHAPLLTGRDLDKYLSYGINSDHECSSVEEAQERIRKGQWLMIRQGSAARNLKTLLPLFDGMAASRCLLVTDDKAPGDILSRGHIDHIIRKAVKRGKDPLTAIRMASLNAAQCFNLKNVGAVAPGYVADLLILDDLNDLKISDVYKAGKKVVENGKVLPFDAPVLSEEIKAAVYDTVHCQDVTEKDFYIEPKGKKVRVIRTSHGSILTDEVIMEPDFTTNNGIDVERDLLKIAVIERHRYTGHIGLGFITGIGLKEGAIASTVSHDSHNIIVIGTNDADMARAVAQIKEIGGGNVVIRDGEVLAQMKLPIAGLMSDQPLEIVAAECDETRNSVYQMGVPANIEPFMNMAFVSLPVIPHLKLTTQGYVDVDRFERVPLFVEED